MSPAELTNPIKVGPEKCNTVKAQNKYFKIAILNMFKVFKEDINNLTFEICKNTKSGIVGRKTVKGMKVKIKLTN